MQPQQTLWLRRSISWRRNSWKVPGSAWKSPPRFSHKSTMASYMDDWKISKFKWWILCFTAKHIGGCFRGSLLIFSQKKNKRPPFPKKRFKGVGFLLVPFSWTKNFPTQQPRCLFFVTVVFLGSSISVTLKNHQNPQAPDPKIALPAPWRRCFTWRRRGCPMLSREIRRSGPPPEPPPGDFFFGGGGQRGPTKWACSFFVWSVFDDDFFQVTSFAPISGGATSDLRGWLQDQLATVRSSFYKLQKARAKKLYVSSVPCRCIVEIETYGDLDGYNAGWILNDLHSDHMILWMKIVENFKLHSWILQGVFLRLPSVFHVGMWFVGLPLVQEHQELSDQSKAALEERADLVARIEQEIFFGVKSIKMPGFQVIESRSRKKHRFIVDGYHSSNSWIGFISLVLQISYYMSTWLLYTRRSQRYWI